MELNYLHYIIISISVVSFLLLVWVFTMERRLRKFFRGQKASSLENVLVVLGEDLKRLGVEKDKIKSHLEVIEGRLKKSIQNVNTVRFNPFEHSGSNQSFVVSFLDEEGDGAVISSLYSREGVRVYAKPIKSYASEYSLSEEEKEAINTTS